MVPFSQERGGDERDDHREALTRAWLQGPALAGELILGGVGPQAARSETKV